MKINWNKVIYGAGTLLTIAGVGMVAKKTYDYVDSIDNFDAQLDDIKTLTKSDDNTEEENLELMDSKTAFKTKAKITVKFIGQTLWHYKVPIALSIAGYAGHKVAYKGMEKKLKTTEKTLKITSEALAGLTATHFAYRNSVREEIGKEREEELYYNVKNTEVTEVDENGNEVTTVKKETPDGLCTIEYSKTTNPYAYNDWDMDEDQVRTVFNYANEKLKNECTKIGGHGRVVAYDIVKELGINDSFLDEEVVINGKKINKWSFLRTMCYTYDKDNPDMLIEPKIERYVNSEGIKALRIILDVNDCVIFE